MQKELSEMTRDELREECKKSGISYSKLTKEQLVQELQAIKSFQFTDRNFKPISKGDPVMCRIKGANWAPGIILKMRKVDDDEYIYALMEGQNTAKVFHSGDVDSDSEKNVQLKELKKKISEKAMREGENQTAAVDEPSKPKLTDYNPPVGDGINGFKKTKHDQHLADIDIGDLRPGDEVKFMISKRSKFKPGQEVTGKLKSFIWDTQDNLAYFIVVHEGKDFYKTVKSVERV